MREENGLGGWLATGALLLAEAAGAVEVQGHRGARARFPENTLPAFRYALEQGVDVLELDLAVTKDLKLVVSHDPHLNPEICLGPDGRRLEKPILIHSLTLAELKKHDCGALKNARFAKQQPVPGTPMPTLDEVFALVKESKLPAARKVRFNIETKIRPDEPENTVGPEVFARLLVDSIKRAGMWKRSVIQSFDYRTLREARKADASAQISALSEDPESDLAAIARELKADVISPKWELMNAERVAKIRATGAKIVPWTANDADAWQKLVELKVDGIISDDPEALIAYLKSRGLRQ
jgi:glycerophosphoryl diester phosphodiesterase